MKHTIIIAGGRDFDDYSMLEQKVDQVIAKWKKPDDTVEIVSGGARGADALGEKYAKKRKCKLKLFSANWEKHGKSTGYKRNKKMAKYAGICLCFWDGKSKGTKHMIDLAEKYDLILHVFGY